MLNKRFLKTVAGFIKERSLLGDGDKCLVALSGGADSVALALVLGELGYDVEAAHCNFHLRGEESDRDEDFCKRFCKRNDIPLHIARFDTRSYAALHKVSIEMAARNLRYAYFRQLLADIGAAAVCVAHHRDDSAETVIMNLIRGTGIHGLTGIRPRNGNIVRPLLCVSRADIENVLRLAGQDFVTDSTNLVDDVVRNKIRLDILPLMKEINPSAAESIVRTATRVAEAAEVLDCVTADAVKRVVTAGEHGALRLSLKELETVPSPEHVLFDILKDRGFTPSQTELIYNTLFSEPGRVFVSPSHRLLVDRGCLIVEPAADNDARCMKIPEEGVYVYNDNLKFRVEHIILSSDKEIIKSPDILYADIKKVGFPLIVRRTAAGDRFVPFGMTGSKAVSDYLTDVKMNLFDKQRQLVITDVAGRILWLVGRRSDNRCRVSEQTTEALKITLVTR